jgi:hypothetical protein
MNSHPTPRPPTAEEREWLGQFVHMEITLDELLARLNGAITLEISPTERRLTSHLTPQFPSVRVEKRDVQTAIERYRKGEISERRLVRWAAMLLMNDVYDWEGPDEDEIAEVLNDLAMVPPKIPDCSAA